MGEGGRKKSGASKRFKEGNEGMKGKRMLSFYRLIHAQVAAEPVDDGLVVTGVRTHRK